MGRHLHIDPFAGIAGDMFLGACIDLGVPLEAIDAALRPLLIERPFRLTLTETYRHAIRGVDFKVVVAGGSEFTVQGPEFNHSHDHHHTHDHGHSHSHSHDLPQASSLKPQAGTYRYILDLIQKLDASARVKERARAISVEVAQAESKVHGIPVEAVHFHEVGAVDSIVDMLGAAVAMEALDVETVSCAPLPIGQGFVRCAHGTMPLPAPATAEILKRVPHFGVNWQGETVTPTGAAIVAALAAEFGPQPPMRVEKVGYGAGDRDPAEVPNLLRLFLGQRA